MISQHAKQRAMERYGKKLSNSDALSILRKCVPNNGYCKELCIKDKWGMLRPLDKGLFAYRITYKNETYDIVVSRRHDPPRIVTFLPKPTDPTQLWITTKIYRELNKDIRNDTENNI